MLEHIQVPRPESHSVFEDMVCDVVSQHLRTDNLQRFARNGQSQYGVDVVGFVPGTGLLGIQCKHYPRGITNRAIDGVVSLADSFTPRLRELLITVSSENEGDVEKYVLQVSQARIAQGLSPVKIWFWREIAQRLMQHPSIIYKYYPAFFDLARIEVAEYAALDALHRKTVTWPATKDDLLVAVKESLYGVPRVDPYRAALAVSTFADADFTGKADVFVSLPSLLLECSEEERFVRAANTLNRVRALLTGPEFSREVIVFPNTRLPIAYLIGWVFRRTTNHELLLIHREDAWATRGLPAVSALLNDDLPVGVDQSSREVAMLLDCTPGSRNLQESVVEWANSRQVPPRIVVSTKVEGGYIHSAAHALAVATEVSRRIKQMISGWGVTHIHLFGPVPAALATLIGYNLNAICSISIYYLGDDRQTYVLGGTLHNNL